MKLYCFYETYTGPRYGLLEDMVTLYLLAFVRFAHPHCYLTVKTEAGLKVKTGKPPLDNRIGPADVVQVSWTKGRLHRALDRLVQAIGPSWNDLVEFARLFDDALKATTEHQDVETQQDRLFKAQIQWHEKIEGLRPRLRRLAQATKGSGESYLALLDRVDRVCLTTRLDEFEQVLKEEFKRDKEQFGEAFERVKALDELDRRYLQDLLNALAYLDVLENLPEGSPLTAERELLQSRFALDTLCRQPSQAGAVLEAFEQFRRGYSTRYQVHYREYRKQLVALTGRLNKLRWKV